ncbi:hypothetical protein [Streptomyces sp. NBC_00658]|uniref:hypothetical protein n=1 Tax=Streptomyces sp. NBC_00658 TaxID=2975800 RepID=UPI00387040CD
MNSSWIGGVDGGDAEVDDAAAGGDTVELGEFLLSSGEADLEPFDFAKPAFTFGLGDAGVQVVADVGESGALGWIRSKERASDAGLSELVPYQATFALSTTARRRRSSAWRFRQMM